MGELSSIVSSDLQDGLNLNGHSCINNCFVGRYFNLGLFSYVANSVIGNYCTFGNRVSIGSFNHPIDWLSIHEFQYRDTTDIYGDSLYFNGQNILKNSLRDTLLGSDVWVADNAVVVRGVSVGHGAIVGAGSFVNRDIPPYAIVSGNPCQIVKYRFDQRVIDILIHSKWWELSMGELSGVDFSNIDLAINQLMKKFPERFD